MLEQMRPNITGITLIQMTKIITDEMKKEGRLKTAFMREYHIEQFCKYYGGDIILQNLTQLKALYEKDWESIVLMLYLSREKN